MTNAERIKAARQRKADVQPTADDWREIAAKKNTDADLRKLRAVKAAMDGGELSRNPDDMYTKAGRLKPFSKAEALRLYPQLVEQQREATLRKMVEETPANYRLITTEAQFGDLLADLLNEPIFAIDTETTGLDVYTDHIVGISLTLPKADYHVYIPVAHDEGRQLDRDYVLGGLRPLLVDEDRGKVYHNASYDIQMFMRYGIEPLGLRWDTQNAMPLLNENEPSFALKNLATKYLDEPSDRFDELFGKDAKFNTISLDVALVYAAKDTDLTWRLYEFQRKHMAKMPEVLDYCERVEIPLIPAIIAMERTGFHIDKDFAKEYGESMLAEIERKEASLLARLGDINLNSPVQLKPALEAVTGEKLASTDAKKVLKPLAKKHDVIAELLEYKNLTKLHSTYINVLPDLVHPKTGRLHARFNPMGARTGRFSSGGNGVNLQNQPKEARKLFVAPPGYVILGGDWSQQEYRCLTYFSQEPKLIDNYRKGNDLYSTIAAEVFDKPIEECGDGSVYRKQTKVILLAVAYGTGPRTLAMQLGKTQKEAKAFLASFDERFPKVAEWIAQNRKFVQKHGYVWMHENQRKRRLPDARNRNSDFWYTSVFTQSTNAIIQGSSAIQTKATMIELQKLCERKTAEGRGEWRLWCVVHDEAILLVPDSVTQQDVKDFENVMLNSYKFGDIPNKTDIEFYKRWGDGIKLAEWFANKSKGEATT